MACMQYGDLEDYITALRFSHFSITSLDWTLLDSDIP